MSAETTDADAGVRVERADGLRVVHLTKAPVNALDMALVDRLLAVTAALAADGECRCVLVRSDLDVFAAGADLKMLDAAGSGLDEAFRTGVQRAFGRVESLPVPVVVAVNGHALGGGLELVLACDVRLVSDRPGLKLGLPEARSGLLPGAGGTQRLSRLLGKTRALDLMLSGRSLDAATALAWGVVTEVVPHDELDARARAVAESFAEGPTQAYRAIKACVLHAVHGDLTEGLDMERDEARRLMATADAAEGLRSFVERRTPRYVGR